MKRLLPLFCILNIVACNTNHLDSDSKKIVKDTLRTSASIPAPSTDDQTARLSQSVDMKINEKGMSRVNGKNMMRFEISITNKSDQAITAIKGRFVVNSIFGDHLKNYNLKYDDANVKPGKTIKVTRYWDYDKTAQEDDKIRTTPLSKLTITYEPETIFFADGSSLH